MTTERQQTLPIKTELDISVTRQEVRLWSVALGFSIVEQTKIVTAASELARNALIYGGGGTVSLEALSNGIKKGLKLTFEDQGPGIANLDLAMKDGYTTGKGLGLGLGGAKRLVNDFDIQSAPGKGTKITVTRWH